MIAGFEPAYLAYLTFCPYIQVKMAPRKKSSRRLMGVARDDSDDELGADDHPWEWVYASSGPSQSPSTAAGPGLESGRKRKREDVPQEIVGARMGKLECRVGDCVLLKAEGSNEPWVAIIEEFIESDEDGDKAAKFLWFSTEKELRNRERKRTDYLWVSIFPRTYHKFIGAKPVHGCY